MEIIASFLFTYWCVYWGWEIGICVNMYIQVLKKKKNPHCNLIGYLVFRICKPFSKSGPVFPFRERFLLHMGYFENPYHFVLGCFQVTRKLKYIWRCVCSVAQWFPTLCDPIDCNPPGSSTRPLSPFGVTWLYLHGYPWPCPLQCHKPKRVFVFMISTLSPLLSTPKVTALIYLLPSHTVASWNLSGYQ